MHKSALILLSFSILVVHVAAMNETNKVPIDPRGAASAALQKAYKNYTCAAYVVKKSYNPEEDFEIDANACELVLSESPRQVEVSPTLRQLLQAAADHTAACSKLSSEQKVQEYSARVANIWLSLYEGVPGYLHGTFFPPVCNGQMTWYSARRYLKYAAALKLSALQAQGCVPLSAAVYSNAYGSEGSPSLHYSYWDVPNEDQPAYEPDWEDEDETGENLQEYPLHLPQCVRTAILGWGGRDAEYVDYLNHSSLRTVLIDSFLDWIRFCNQEPQKKQAFGSRALGKLLNPYATQEYRSAYMRHAMNYEGVDEETLKLIRDKTVLFEQLPEAWHSSAYTLAGQLAWEYLSTDVPRRMSLPKGYLIPGDIILAERLYGGYSPEAEKVIQLLKQGDFPAHVIVPLNACIAEAKQFPSTAFQRIITLCKVEHGGGKPCRKQLAPEKQEHAELIACQKALYLAATLLPKELVWHIADYVTKYPLYDAGPSKPNNLTELKKESAVVSPKISWRLHSAEITKRILTPMIQRMQYLEGGDQKRNAASMNK